MKCIVFFIKLEPFGSSASSIIRSIKLEHLGSCLISWTLLPMALVVLQCPKREAIESFVIDPLEPAQFIYSGHKGFEHVEGGSSKKFP